jgi:hypothetical protein
MPQTSADCGPLERTARWLWAETRALLGLLRELATWLVGAAAVVALIAAFQFRPLFTLDLGGVENGSGYDAPYVQRFYTRETNSNLTGRWTRANSQVILPGLGGNYPVLLTVRLSGWRPDNAELPKTKLAVNGVPIAAFEPVREFQTYSFVVAGEARARADFVLQFETATFVPGKNDRRALGVMVDWVRVEPAPDAAGWVTPALDQLAAWGGFIFIFYLLLRRVAVKKSFALAAALVVTALVAVLFASERLWFTVFERTPFYLAVGAYISVVLLAVLLPRVFRNGGAPIGVPELNALLFIFVLAFVLKAFDVLYPNTVIVDHLWHWRVVERMLRGEINSFLFPEDLARAQFPGLIVPYVPTYYFLLAPFQVFVGSFESFVKALSALMEALKIPLVYFIARKTFDDARAAWLAAFLYAIIPLPFLSLSWGNYPTMLGLLWTLITIAVFLAVYPRLNTRRAFWQWTLILAFTFLTYAIMPLLIVPLFLILAGILLLARARPSAPLARILLALVAAGMIAFLAYYIYPAVPIVTETLPRLLAGMVGGERFVVGSGSKPATSSFFAQTLNWMNSYSIPLLVVLFVGGLAVAWRGFKDTVAFWMLVACLVTFVLLTGVSYWFDLVQKQTFFVAPALCVGAGFLFARAWDRGRVPRALVALLTFYLTYQGIFLAFWRITTTRH